MANNKWKDVIGAVAPTVAGALGGPLAGLAASVAGRILLGTDNADASEITDYVMANQTPETFAQLKEIEAELTVKLRELEVEQSKINATDRADAREREEKIGNNMVTWLAAMIFGGFFGILSGLMFMTAIPEESMDALLIMLGSLGTLLTQVGAYYFGSSKGSTDKNVVIREALTRK